MRVLFRLVVALALSGAEIETALSDTTIYDPKDVGLVKESLYRHCLGERPPSEGDATYPLPDAERDGFCRCFGDYLGDLLADFEVQYVVNELAATPSILDKEGRAREMCNAMTSE